MANAAGDNALCGVNEQHNKSDQDIVETWKLSHKAWQTFNDLRKNKLFFDVNLKTDDGLFHPAHKIVLCSCGEYFRSLFSGRWNCSSSEVNIPGIKSNIFEKVLEFAYKREISLTSLSATKELFIVANQLGLDDIITKCSSYIKSKINSYNCLDIWCFSRDYFCKVVEESSFLYILNHFSDVVGTRRCHSTLHFTKLGVTDLQTILKSDELFVESELLVFQAMMKWMRADLETRREELYKLVCSVRLGLLRKNHLQNVVGRDSIIQKCPRTRRLVNLHIEISKLHGLRRANSIHTSLKHTFSPRTLDVLRQTMRPRYPHRLVLVVGGWSRDSPTNVTEAYDPLTETWFDISPTMPPILQKSRAYHGIAYLKGHIYMIGGFDGEVTYRSCDRFHLSSWEWKAMNGMNHGRCYVATAVLDGLIYAIGGSSRNNLSRLRSAEVFNPYLNSWTLLPDMAECRSDAGACSFNNRIYVAGGFTGHTCVFSAEFYEVESNQWTSITPMRIPRSGVSVLAYKGRILAMGGFDGDTTRLNSVESYNPDTNTWSLLSHMQVGRSNFGACVIDDKILAIGGYDGKATCSKVECYEEDQSSIVGCNSGFEILESLGDRRTNGRVDGEVVRRRTVENINEGHLGLGSFGFTLM